MSTPMEVGKMPGGMEGSSSKGKKGDPLGYFSSILSRLDINMSRKGGDPHLHQHQNPEEIQEEAI